MAPDAPSVRPETPSLVTRDQHGNVLCCHGRPFQCSECGEEYARELDAPPNTERAELIAALRAMVASYDGLRDALTCPIVIAKLAAADAVLAKVDGVARITGASS